MHSGSIASSESRLIAALYFGSTVLSSSDEPILLQVRIGTAVFNPADRLGIRGEGLAVTFSNRVHSLAECRRIKVSQMHLRDVMVERHDGKFTRLLQPAGQRHR